MEGHEGRTEYALCRYSTAENQEDPVCIEGREGMCYASILHQKDMKVVYNLSDAGVFFAQKLASLADRWYSN